MLTKLLKIQHVYHDLFLKNQDVILIQKIEHSIQQIKHSKIVNHLDETAPIDILIDYSNSCELLTCIAAYVSFCLYVRFFGVLHQPGGCKAFLEAAENQKVVKK